MRDVSSQNFGLLIAYLLPGFTVLWGISHLSPTVQSWIGTTTVDAPTVGGFLYVTIASVAAGLTVSTIRWCIIDTIHHHSGIPEPVWDFSRFDRQVTGFHTLVDHQYRYFQFYANHIIALPIAGICRWSNLGIRWTEFVLLLLLEILFFAASRNTLAKYYERVSGLLDSPK